MFSKNNYRITEIRRTAHEAVIFCLFEVEGLVLNDLQKLRLKYYVFPFTVFSRVKHTDRYGRNLFKVQKE